MSGTEEMFHTKIRLMVCDSIKMFT
jgi:hypothetical protein